MNRKPIIIAIFWALLGCLSAQPLVGDSISLAQLQNLAQQGALQVLRAQTDWEIAGLDEEQLRASLLPRLDLSANLPNFFKSFSETVQPDGTIAFRPISINNSFAQLQVSQPLAATGGTFFVRSNLQRFDDLENDFTNYNGIPIRVGWLQPIFGYNDWKWQKRILPARSQELEASYQAARYEAAFTATQLFFQLLFADQEKRIALNNQAAGDRLLRIAQERYELGKINRGDLLQIELDRAAAAQALIRAERDVGQATAAIYQLLGWAFNEGSSLLIPKIPKVVQHATIEAQEALQRSLSRRPELKTNQRLLLEIQSERERISRELGPQLQLQASLGLVRSDVAVEKIYSDPQAEQILSLNLQLPLLDWGSRKKAIAQVDHRSKLLAESNQRSQMELASTLYLAVSQWNQLGEEIQLAERIRQLAEERFQISSESYVLGSIPLTELTLAQQNRDQLNRAYLASLQNYWLTLADIQRMTLD